MTKEHWQGRVGDAESLLATRGARRRRPGPQDKRTCRHQAAETEARTLADAMRGSDVFCGVSSADIVTKDMVRSMADNPIVFAMANPDPEIPYPVAVAGRKDVIMATGRSDYPNQVNNVLGFPFIFRGALDVECEGAIAIDSGCSRPSR